ncbi:ABC transporter permease [Micromonospora craniellae]|uniref:ABC transporter permease n=1 Tax=Micromonospora craniellae TaxID=2294034 RepID=A0A372G468_9ACTN|nr:ABC transporter permease [Micromonospora craniellae]QOC92989.1 ABC transporter permease [Micromonospora craniellae]RFS47768.1 ABC transporter permease [Micromonospora craniellae]
MNRNRTFTLTALLLGLAFLVTPLVFVVVNSFNDSGYGAWPPPGWSLRWYERLAEQEGFAQAALRSLGIAVVAALAAVVAGTAAAVSLTRFRYPGRGLVESLLLAPLIVPKVAIGLGAFILFLQAGFYGSDGALVGLHLVLLLPFTVNIVGGALVRIPLVYEQAARDLGAGPVRAFVSATLPQLRRSLLAAYVLCFMISFDEVDATVFVVSPDQLTLPVSMYQYLQRYQDPTLAALSTILIGATFALVAVVMATAGTSAVSGLHSGKERRR